MVRSPCCDKNGIKKGPWTCQEDNILLSYVQEHGPGHWKSIPANTGLMRCSKSCRLRWTNYLRPGIKRGNFTTSEEGIIVHLQSILGNKWAAIASYLPQRTDNDIKNYWNTHLKKKLKKYQILNTDHNSFVSRFDSTVQNNIIMDSENASSIYASSTENISKLLESWKRSSPQVMREIQYDDITKENENVSTEDEARPVFSYLENWLLDETPALVDGFLEISGLDSYYPPY